MQAFRVVYQCAGKIGLHSTLYTGNICDNRADSAGGQAVESSHAHPAHKHNLAITDRIGHETMTSFGGRISAMLFTMMFMLSAEMAVIGFWAPFSTHDLTIFDGEHLVKLCSSKVC